MDLKDYLVRFHPEIVKSYERDKNQLKPPPLSAPGDLVFTQGYKQTKFPFPAKLRVLSTFRSKTAKYVVQL